MVVKFGKVYLRELFEEGKCSDKFTRLITKFCMEIRPVSLQYELTINIGWSL